MLSSLKSLYAISCEPHRCRSACAWSAIPSAFKSLYAISARETPQPGNAVVARRQQSPAVGRKRRGHDRLAVPLEGLHAPPRPRTPQLRRAIVRGRDKSQVGRHRGLAVPHSLPRLLDVLAVPISLKISSILIAERLCRFGDTLPFVMGAILLDPSVEGLSASGFVHLGPSRPTTRAKVRAIWTAPTSRLLLATGTLIRHDSPIGAPSVAMAARQIKNNNNN
mmetsp:Transcript_71815/g.206145  ORF Transcript_71815/g.206145 Transcript_71815/m.206145 type:complete len:222 (+) Transcript_71815:1128-1793(+)